MQTVVLAVNHLDFSSGLAPKDKPVFQKNNTCYKT
jgi:hypothetical protein